jgi:cytochrome c-type biogenesis protein CcmE
MQKQSSSVALVVVLFVAVVAMLAWSGIRADKSYYVTINELQSMGNKAYTRHLRVAGNVAPGSIEHRGTGANFVLVENDKHLTVNYQGAEPPPDTFKDNSQALAIGTYGRDGVIHATQLQAKCASKYAPKAGAGAPASSAAMATPSASPAAQ